MTATTDPAAIAQAYLQADRSPDPEAFGAFTRALKAVAARDGGAAARALAAKAVSPHLDYSSLLRLRRFMPEGPAGEEKRLRIAVLGGPTTAQLVQLVELFLAAEGIPVSLFEGEYGIFRQALLGPEPRLDGFRPQVVFLATGAGDVARLPGAALAPRAVEEMADQELESWARLWDAANRRWGATVLQNNFEIPVDGVFGHYALRQPVALENYLGRLNALFAERAPGHVVLHDLAAIARREGAARWFDPRFRLEAKLPCGPESLVAYAHSAGSLVRAIVGRSRKVLVLDLDNTLWGGQVGDAGPGGVVVGQGSAEGEAYLAFQRYAGQLHDRGVLLAVCSKNDEEKAREPFQVRDDLALRLPDFSCFVANWRDKAENLRAIAVRLNLGLDSLVFFDDNPAERALVRRFVPEVSVPDVPADPSGYIEALARYRYFEAVSFTGEDAARARYYAENARRSELSARATDIDSFLASLNMRARVGPVSELNIERVTQLVNKSNQFNLTTRRYTVAEIREMTQREDWRTLTVSLRDDLGDNGLISVLLLRLESGALRIDTWVMSCRVLQRGVEQLAFNEAVRMACAAGAHELRGEYIPTPKNGMVGAHYPGLGFAPAGCAGGTTFWSLPLAGPPPAIRTHIAMEDDPTDG